MDVFTLSGRDEFEPRKEFLVPVDGRVWNPGKKLRRNVEHGTLNARDCKRKRRAANSTLSRNRASGEL